MVDLEAVHGKNTQRFEVTLKRKAPMSPSRMLARRRNSDQLVVIVALLSELTLEHQFPKLKYKVSFRETT